MSRFVISMPSLGPFPGVVIARRATGREGA